MESWSCCGGNIIISNFLTCAKSLAYIGLIFSFVYLNIFFAIAFIMVLIGINKERPNFLIPALLILALYIVKSILKTIIYIYFAIDLSEDKIKSFKLNRHYSVKDAKKAAQLDYLSSALIAFIFTLLLIFTFFIIYKSRKHLIKENIAKLNGPPSFLPQAYTTLPMPIHYNDGHATAPINMEALHSCPPPPPYTLKN